jgi:L,D-transpeptidase catalytic domain
MRLLKRNLYLFLRFLNPLKTETMKAVHTKWVYMSVICLLFLQIPLLPAGDLPFKNQLTKNNFVLPAVKEKEPLSFDELIKMEADSIYDTLQLVTRGLQEEAFELAYKGYYKLVEAGKVNRPGILSIVDFSKSSNQKRFFIIDMNSAKILYHTLVAHGRNSGLYYATDFSNKQESNKSSLGFYVTLNTYYGEKGYSLKLQGLEKGINDNAYDRNIVLHGSDYVTNEFARSNGYLGRSLGCPAVPVKQSTGIVNTIKNGTVLFIYHPTKNYLKQSNLLAS